MAAPGERGGLYVEYAKSGRSSCKACGKPIANGSVRIGQETKSTMHDGWDMGWFHVRCCNKVEDAPRFSSIAELKGWEYLRWADQHELRSKVGERSDDSTKEANERLWEVKDALSSNVPAKVLKELVAANGVTFEKANGDRILHIAADGMLLGKPGPCPVCSGPMVFFNGLEFRCHGWASSFTRCNWKGAECKRFKWVIPEELADRCKFLAKWEVPESHPTEPYPAAAAAAAAPAAAEPGVEGAAAAAAVVAAAGGVGEKRAEPVKKKLEPKPGSDVLRIDPEAPRTAKTEVLVTYDAELGYCVWHAMLNVTDISTGVNKFYRMQILKNSTRYTFFIHWGRTGTDIGDKKSYPNLSQKGAMQRFEEKFRDCTGLSWDQRLAFSKQPGKYSMVDLDDGNEDADTLDEVEKRRRAKRQKKDGGGGEEANPEQALAAAAANPGLDERVRSFISLIFDRNMMKRQLQAMNVDVKKMPLGKISRKQIQQGYAVLSALSETLQQKDVAAVRVADLTNRFYTIVPHDFGTRMPPLIDNDELVKAKIDLLDVLCDIEQANVLMAQADEAADQIQQNYQSLHTRITPIPKDSELYKLLEKYAYDSHDASYFRNWTFKVEDIFEIEREGERERFKPWAENGNRMLLWHGSRLTNYVGILSTGLRIAPPEAPKTGYRFGKGAYFADTSSKSASYCFATRESPYGVMILNEVAVGRPFETPNDIYMEKPMPGTDSTWALGMTVPDPKATTTMENGTTVPMGKPSPAGRRTMCSHNEIIVYDVAQVTIRYALRISFTFK